MSATETWIAVLSVGYAHGVAVREGNEYPGNRSAEAGPLHLFVDKSMARQTVFEPGAGVVIVKRGAKLPPPIAALWDRGGPVRVRQVDGPTYEELLHKHSYSWMFGFKFRDPSFVKFFLSFGKEIPSDEFRELPLPDVNRQGDPTCRVVRMPFMASVGECTDREDFCIDVGALRTCEIAYAGATLLIRESLLPWFNDRKRFYTERVRI